MAGCRFVALASYRHYRSISNGSKGEGQKSILDERKKNELKEEEVSRQLDILALRHVLDEDGGRYAIKDLDVAAYYANTLVPHLEIARASKEPKKFGAT